MSFEHTAQCPPASVTSIVYVPLAIVEEALTLRVVVVTPPADRVTVGELSLKVNPGGPLVRNVTVPVKSSTEAV